MLLVGKHRKVVVEKTQGTRKSEEKEIKLHERITVMLVSN